MASVYDLLSAFGLSPPSDEDKIDFIGLLPLELTRAILGLLDGGSLLSAALVCRRWLSVLRDDASLRTDVRAHLLWLRLQRAWDVVGAVEVLRDEGGSGSSTGCVFAPRNGRYRVVRQRYSGQAASAGFPYDVTRRRSGRVQTRLPTGSESNREPSMTAASPWISRAPPTPLVMDNDLVASIAFAPPLDATSTPLVGAYRKKRLATTQEVPEGVRALVQGAVAERGPAGSSKERRAVAVLARRSGVLGRTGRIPSRRLSGARLQKRRSGAEVSSPGKNLRKVRKSSRIRAQQKARIMRL